MEASKGKLISAVFIVLLAIGGLESLPASAASLFVGGVKLSTGSKAAVASKAVVDESVIFNVPGFNLRISCSGSNAIASTLVGENKGEAEARIFEGCSEVSPANCKLTTRTIETESVQTTFIAVTKTSEARFILEPKKTNGNFAILAFEGTCVFAGEQPVKGVVKGSLPTGQIEEVSQAVEGLGSAEGNNSMELDKNKVFVEKGRGLVKLVSGSKWSFR